MHQIKLIDLAENDWFLAFMQLVICENRERLFLLCVCVEGSQVAEAGLYLQHYIQHRADHADHA